MRKQRLGGDCNNPDEGTMKEYHKVRNRVPGISRKKKLLVLEKALHLKGDQKKN